MAETQFADVSRLHHAYIVSEPDGEKSLSLARELAAALVCSADGPVPCGICPACRKVRAGIHPDVITISRETGKDGKKKTEISVNQIRAMGADAYVLPNESPRKVYIVDEAEKMNFSAQNAALWSACRRCASSCTTTESIHSFGFCARRMLKRMRPVAGVQLPQREVIKRSEKAVYRTPMRGAKYARRSAI